MNDKGLVWLQNEIKSPPFSSRARRQAGLLLRLLQQGETLSLPHSRPMPRVGRGCHELRILDNGNNWRIVYRIDEDVILILEVFAKKTITTPQHVIDTCRIRIKAYDSLT